LQQIKDPGLRFVHEIKNNPAVAQEGFGKIGPKTGKLSVVGNGGSIIDHEIVRIEDSISSFGICDIIHNLEYRQSPKMSMKTRKNALL
jgi:hypothetical protein